MTVEEAAKVKAKELVNMYYCHARTQEDAIQMVDNVLLTTLCQKIDSIHCHIFFRNDFDEALVKSSIQQLKWWQEVAYEVGQIKLRLPV